MKLNQVSTNVYYFMSPVNVGYIYEGETGLLIDTGLDRSAMNKILQQLDEKRLPLTHLFITHAHADHFGGAEYLQEKRDIITIAPKFEEAILRYPKLEPIYLFHGVNPPKEMRNKFLEAKPMRVDQVVTKGVYKWGELNVKLIDLPGHSEHQLGLYSHNILFAGDGYMGVELLKKHRLPFLTDYKSMIESLNRLMSFNAQGAIPGHGEYETEFKHTVYENILFYENLLEELDAFLNQTFPSGGALEDAVAEISHAWDISFDNIGTWSLYRTAITAYIMGLCSEGKRQLMIHHHKLWITSVNQD